MPHPPKPSRIAWANPKPLVSIQEMLEKISAGESRILAPSGASAKKSSRRRDGSKLRDPPTELTPIFVFDTVLPLPGFPCTVQVVFAGRALHEIFHKDDIKEDADASSPSKGIDYSSIHPPSCPPSFPHFSPPFFDPFPCRSQVARLSVWDPVLSPFTLSANSHSYPPGHPVNANMDNKDDYYQILGLQVPMPSSPSRVTVCSFFTVLVLFFIFAAAER